MNQLGGQLDLLINGTSDIIFLNPILNKFPWLIVSVPTSTLNCQLRLDVCAQIAIDIVGLIKQLA